MTKKQNKRYVEHIQPLTEEELTEEHNEQEEKMKEAQRRLATCIGLQAIRSHAETCIDCVEKIREIAWLRNNREK